MVRAMQILQDFERTLEGLIAHKEALRRRMGLARRGGSKRWPARDVLRVRWHPPHNPTRKKPMSKKPAHLLLATAITLAAATAATTVVVAQSPDTTADRVV